MELAKTGPNSEVVLILGGLSSEILLTLQAKGHDTSRHVLACFGGAGGQHACAIARSLGMTQVYVHRFALIVNFA